MIKFLVVLYNKKLCECETCLSMMRWDETTRSKIAELYVWNNSASPLPEEDKREFLMYFPKTEVTFIEDGLNHPLSEVYNSIIEKTDEKGILVIWDHDSRIPEEYLGCLLKVSKENASINLFLPQVFFNKKLVSPAKMIYFWGRTIKQIPHGLHLSKNTTAINSGMAIRCSYLKNEFVGYNPKIKFYGTDNDFMYKYRSQNEKYYVLPIRLKHELNSFSKTDLEDSLRRYKDIKNGLYRLAEDFPLFPRIMTYIYVFLESTKHNILNRTFKFWN